MKNTIKRLVANLLHKIANDIDSGNCTLEEEQAMDIMSCIGHEVLSKDAACSYLNISRSKFDSLVAEGKLPQGRKRRGFKELVFYKDEISEALNKSIIQK